MRKLTEQEIKFLKETGWTPTMFQMNTDKEYSRALIKRPDENIDWNEFYIDLASDLYQVDLLELFHKCTEEYDFISLENEAPYVMSVLLSIEQLDDFIKDGKAALAWLQDWQYFCGYRKASEDEAVRYADIAQRIKCGVLVAHEYSDTDDSIWVFNLEGDLV